MAKQAEKTTTVEVKNLKDNTVRTLSTGAYDLVKKKPHPYQKGSLFAKVDSEGKVLENFLIDGAQAAAEKKSATDVDLPTSPNPVPNDDPKPEKTEREKLLEEAKELGFDGSDRAQTATLEKFIAEANTNINAEDANDPEPQAGEDANAPEAKDNQDSSENKEVDNA